MNKADLVEKVARDANITKKAAARAVDSVFDGISYSLQKGKRVTLVGFGSFEVRRRAPRRARNPRTGTIINVPAKKVPKFRPGSELRKKVR
jgi:DNA-binding protein HU-beta